MKRIVFYFLILSFIFHFSCAVPLYMALSKSKTVTMELLDSTVRPPLSFKEVRFYNSKSQVKNPYIEVASLYSHWTGYATRGKIIKSMKIEAGKIGANAVVWEQKDNTVTAIYVHFVGKVSIPMTALPAARVMPEAVIGMLPKPPH